jgi:putative transposase
MLPDYRHISRTSFNYKPKENNDDAIRIRLKELAQKRRRSGCRRLHVMLRREGFMINHRKTERLYKKEKLALRIRRRKKYASLLRTEIPKLQHPNHIWSMDFMKDSLSCGRKIKVLPKVDEYSRKHFHIEVDTSITGKMVCEILNRIAFEKGSQRL